MGVADRLLGRGEARTIREVANRQRWQIDLLSENLRTLEDQMVDGEWRRIGMQLEREFTRAGLDDLMSLSRAMYLSHPLIQRAVNVRTYYTWGQGVELDSHENVMENVVNPMLEDDSNQVEYFAHQARLLTDVDQEVDGNVFQALFVGDPIRIRSIPANEIREIHCNPEDRQEVWFYLREWSQSSFDRGTGRSATESRRALYPDIGLYQETMGAESQRDDYIGGVQVQWQSPVIHQRTGGLKQMRFGIPSTYAALDWARAYKKFLEDWHTIVSSLARFSWKVATKGSKVERVKRKLDADVDTELGGRSGASRGGLPAGNVWVGAGDELTPISKTGTTTSADDARASRLMVAAAMDLPDTILSGDTDQGTLATAKSLDRPTELAMVSRQLMWSHHDQRIFNFAVAVAEQEGRLGAVPDDERKVSVTFPPILEHDTGEVVAAIVAAATLEGKAEAGTMPRELVSRQLMQTLGVDDIEQALKDLGDEEHEGLQAAVDKLSQALQPAAQPAPPPGEVEE